MKQNRNKSEAKAGKIEEIGDQLTMFEAWLYRNWKKLAIAAMMVVVAVGFFLIIDAIFAARENSAADALSRAKDDTELAALVKEYASAEAANPARMRLAMQALNGERYSDALVFLDEISSMSSSYSLVGDSLTLAAATQEKNNQIEDAIARYIRVAQDDRLSAVKRTEAAYQAGRLLIQQGKGDEAVKYLEEASTLATAVNVSADRNIADYYARMARALLYTLQK